MGCDIHLYVERRLASGWAEVNREFNTDRNYTLFEMLADVRGGLGLPVISERRGIPSDASPGVRDIAESWSSDGHSHSHLSLRELNAYDWGAAMPSGCSWAATRGEAAGAFFSETLPALRELSDDGVGDDVRIVFFFDN